ncbi:MAG TPA: TonB-dependent receptor [Longimicrobium sp.]|nr:TonB-dependent receptor [Longimicrobium sp.]
MGRALACAVGLALAAPAAAHAQDRCSAPPAASAARRWPAPLDRTLAFHARDLSLRDALDRLSAATHIRISYSAELLPLERRVCLAPGARTVGDALAELLRDTPVEPVVASADHVVLALRRARQAAAEDEASDELGHTVALDRIVVTGSAGGGPRSALPFALDVIDHAQMEREGTSPLSRFLTTSTAGPWGWEQSPSTLLARYGSIRGASSFGASSPKVFIDGIEVANPLLATQIAPEAIERIEVIRGPQGAALYGTDAISGVVNIVTRHEGTDNGTPRLRVRTGLGMANSEFAAGRAVAQEHAVSLRAGTAVQSAGLDVGVGGVGEYVPEGGSRYLLASGNARRVGARSVLTGTARFFAAGAGPAENPLLRDFPTSVDSVGRQGMRQYTLGGSLRLTPDAVWTHTLIAGIDGDRVSAPLDAYAPVLSVVDGRMGGTEGGADRVTLRWSSVARLYDGARADFAATLAAEHSTLRELVGVDPSAAPTGTDPYVLWTRSTGVVAQANATLDDRLHLTAGVRVERNGGLPTTSRDAFLPVLGAAWVTPLGDDATLKLRVAFGRGIRPLRSPGGGHAWGDATLHRRAYPLAPEEQEGVEGGFDLAVGRFLQLQVTAFDQLASGLIQQVGLPASAQGGVHPGLRLQNLGQITNRGWEVQGSALLGRVSVDGAFSRVDSRVRNVAPTYTGDLRRGDRMLEVPARTLTLTGAYAGDGWSASLTGYRAFDWMGYDRLALARAAADGVDTGTGLRGYWRAYSGVTHLNAAAMADVPGGLVLVLAGENLLDHQRGEPDNATVVPGRTLTLGLRAAF